MTRRIRIGENSYPVTDGEWGKAYVQVGESSIIYLEDFKEAGITFQEDTLENRLRSALKKVQKLDRDYFYSLEFEELTYEESETLDNNLKKAQAELDELLKQVKES